jgi:hypothetical protein
MFTFNFRLKELELIQLGSELERELQDVPSNVRWRALSRSFGFSSLAALKTRLSFEPIVQPVDIKTFRDTIESDGYSAHSLGLFRAVSRLTLRHVVNDNPLLNYEGWGPGSRRKSASGEYESLKQIKSRVERSRKDLVEEHVEEFILGYNLVSMIDKRAKSNPNSSSYHLKHLAEQIPVVFADGHTYGPSYVSNGSLIAAAIAAGFNCRSSRVSELESYPNVTFNMSMPSLRRCEDFVRAR